MTADILIAIEALGAEINEIDSRIGLITELIDHVHDAEGETESEFEQF